MPLADQPSSPSVTVVIVNFNGGEVVLHCLAALQQQQFRDFVTVVVDNHSSDASAELIGQQHPWVILQRLSSNKGFAGGVNHALTTSVHSDLVVLLNPDAYPDPQWLEQLVLAARNHPEYGAFGSRMYSDEALHILDGVGDVYHVSGLVWRQGHGQQDEDRYNTPAEIFAPCAAAALYRTQALRTIGYFDEDFFLYVEDVDVGFRLRLAGFRSMYVPSAKVRHVGSAIVGKHSDSQIYHGHRNLVWVFVQNMPGPLFWLLLPLHIALNGWTLIWFSLKGQGRTITRSKWDAIKGLPRAWRKRRSIQSKRSVRVAEVGRALSWTAIPKRFR